MKQQYYGRQSLYRYSSDELSLIVFNTEGLYNQRHDKGFIKSLRESYQATKKQWEVLKRDLKEDLLESRSAK